MTVVRLFQKEVSCSKVQSWKTWWNGERKNRQIRYKAMKIGDETRHPNRDGDLGWRHYLAREPGELQKTVSHRAMYQDHWNWKAIRWMSSYLSCWSNSRSCPVSTSQRALQEVVVAWGKCQGRMYTKFVHL